MNLSEKAAYIKGLAEGLDLEADKKEVRVIKELLELVGEMASDIEDVSADLSELYDAVEEIDEDLSFVEEEVYGDGEHEHFSEEMYEITCPACGETVSLDEEKLMDGDVICPACGEKIEIELDACDCCDHDHSHEEEE
ncbi:MAG: CD1247 N-terminal domain-containing protein [Oscillospiraceae bacterium]